MSRRKLTVEVPITPEAFVAGLAALPVSGGVPEGDLAVDLLPSAGLQHCQLAVRGGTAHWVQRVDVGPTTLTATQVEGDFSHLEISWTAEEHPDGATVVMRADFATSVPHFAGAIDSAAGRVLVRAALAQAVAVAGTATVTGGRSALADPEPVLTAAPHRAGAPGTPTQEARHAA